MRRWTCRRNEQIEDAERRLFELAETGATMAGSRFADAVGTAVDMAKRRLSARRTSVGYRNWLDHSTPHGRPAAFRPDHPGRAPGMGKTSLATNIAFNIAEPMSRRFRPTARPRRQWRRRRLFSLEMSSEQLGDAYLSRNRPKFPHQNPPRRDQRGRFRKAGRLLAGDAPHSALISTRPAAFRSRSLRHAPGG